MAFNPDDFSLLVHPELRKKGMFCFWMSARTLEDGRKEFTCSQCGDVQVVKDFLDLPKTKECRATSELGYCERHTKMLPCPVCLWRKKKKPGSIRNRKKQPQDFAVARGIDGEKSWAAGSRVGTLGRTTNAGRVRRTPEWVNDDKFVQKMLRQVFPEAFPAPKLAVSKTQRKRAVLWVQIINVWWRRGKAEGAAVYEINEGRSAKDQITPKQLHDTIRRIRKVAAGMTTSGNTRRSRPMGRPRKQPLSDGPDEME